MSIFNTLRILLSELLLHQALRVMPEGEPESKLLKEATDGYFSASAAITHCDWPVIPFPAGSILQERIES